MFRLADALTPEELRDVDLGLDELAGRADRKPSSSELNEISSFRSEHRNDRATKIGGGLFGGKATQTLVAATQDFYRAARVLGPSGKEELWGVSVRLVVAFEATDVDFEVAMPMVAAKAQLGQIKARYKLDLRGYKGTAELSKLLPIPGEFGVETYVELMESIRSIQQLVLSDTEHVDPVLLIFDE